MDTNNSGGKDDEMIEKLDNIDKWLNNIVDTNNEPPKKGGSSANKKIQLPKLFKKKTNQTKMTEPKKNTPTHGQNKPRGGHKPQTHKQHKGHPRPNNPRPQRKPVQKPRIITKGKLRIIPIGGFEEVGKNMMVFEYENDIIIVDMGFQFPMEDMLGVDKVLPDISYLKGKEKNIRGIYLTHGHLDHIGGLPYLLPSLNFPPIYGAPLTIGFVEKQIKEFRLTKQTKLIKFDPKDKLRAGVFDISFFRVNHSIPDAVAIVINTPVGRIVHTGDFKFDFMPADKNPADFQEIAKVGALGVDILVSDSTNAIEPGHTTTEKVIADNLDKIIGEAEGRLIVTSFSSLIGRIQQIMESAIRHKRKIFLTGRSMETNIKIAQNLKYITIPRGVIGDVRKMGKIKDSECIILTTGSQGEDMAALARMANHTHTKVKIKPGDTVVLSSSPIIGNETSVVKLVNKLCRSGADVITNKEINIHTSGHAKQEDLKLMIKLIKPKYLIPAHGEYYMRSAHRNVAMAVGMPKNNVFLMDNGEVLEHTRQTTKKTAERVPNAYVMVEGREQSEVTEHVVLDRQLMAENGTVVLAFHTEKGKLKLKKKPSIASRGFVYSNLNPKMIEEITSAAQASFEQFVQNNSKNVQKRDLVLHIQQHVDRLLVRMLDKRPLVIPVILDN
jgi:ribonuclease J